MQSVIEFFQTNREMIIQEVVERGRISLGGGEYILLLDFECTMAREVANKLGIPCPARASEVTQSVYSRLSKDKYSNLLAKAAACVDVGGTVGVFVVDGRSVFVQEVFHNIEGARNEGYYPVVVVCEEATQVMGIRTRAQTSGST